MEISGKSISEYTASKLDQVKATCLSVAQILGDTIQTDAVIVGGLVPTLLYQDVDPAWEFGAHAGTQDMDLALDLVILEKERYENVAECLKRGGFFPDRNEKGNITRQRWRASNGAQIDFLMPPVPPDREGGRQQSLTGELAAGTMRGLDLALQQRTLVTLSGKDLEGRKVDRKLPICAPDVFIVLKALAIAGRDKPKDAYDIHFVLLHDSRGPRGVAAALRRLLPHEAIDAAVESLKRDYKDVDSRGPHDVCSFLGRPEDDRLAGDALAYVLDFLEVLTA
jgi:hypothetical protein